jgi:[ribosomal protein S18]-alanine N-acetyltransferase
VTAAEVSIRPARAGEGEVLGTIGFMAWERGEISLAGGPDVDRGHVKAHFIEFCTTGYDTILVAEMGGRPVGWGSRENRDNYISDLWVSPGAQGLGAGRRLLEALENDIAKAGYDMVELETAALNASGIRFYERGGYAMVWRGRKFSSGLDKEVDKVRLAKPLGRQRIEGLQ